MIISIRTMKKQLKRKIKQGTYISADVYSVIEKYMHWSLSELNLEIAKIYTESGDRKITTAHVEKAILNLVLTRSEEE